MSKIEVSKGLRCTSDTCIKLNDANKPVFHPIDPFTLGAEVYLAHLEGTSVILEQEGVLCLKARNGYIEFELLTAEKYMRIFAYPLGKHGYGAQEWIQIDVVFDGKKAQLYLMGMPCMETGLIEPGTVEADKEDTPWEIGRMDGYLSYLELYDRVMTENELMQKPLRLKAFYEGQKLLLDYQNGRYFSEPGKKVQIQYIGNTKDVTLTGCLNPGKYGFSIPAVQNQIPLTIEGKTAFTFLCKIFLPDNSLQDWEQVIFSQGTAEDNIFAIGILENSGNPFVRIGKEQFKLTQKLAERVWIDVAVAIEERKVRAYVDGEEAGAFILQENWPFIVQNPVFGNQPDRQGSFLHGFNGLINQIALFDTPLSPDRLKAFTESILNPFSQSLLALWLFENGDPKEQLSGTKLLLDRSSHFMLAEDTVKEPDNKLTLDLPVFQGKLTESEKQELLIIAEALEDTANELTGEKIQRTQPFTEIELCFLAAAIQNTSKEAKDKKDNNRHINGILGGGAPGLLAGLFIALVYNYNKNKNKNDYIIDWHRIVKYIKPVGKFQKAFTFGSSVAGAGAGALIGKLIAKHISEISHEVKINISTDLGSRLQIVSMKFDDSKGDTTGILCPKVLKGEPGWFSGYHKDNDSNSHLLACRLDSSESAHIEIIIKREKKDEQDQSVDCILKVEQKVQDNKTPFFKKAENDFTLKANGDTQVPLFLETQFMNQPKGGRYEVDIFYSIMQKKSKITILSNSIKIYIYLLENLPSAPWTVKKASEFLPIFSIVELLEEIWPDHKGHTEEAFAEAFIEWYKKNKRITRSFKERGDFGYLRESEAVFHIDRFAKEWKSGNKLSLTPLEANSLMLSLARLQGFQDMNLHRLSAMKPGETLQFKADVVPLDEKAGILGDYTVCSKKKGTSPYIWDGFLAKHMPFAINDRDKISQEEKSYFRYQLCEINTNCRLVPDPLQLAFFDKNAMPDLANRPYGIVIIDMWDSHGCNAAAECVNELSAKINDILMNLADTIGKEKTENARIVLCPSDVSNIKSIVKNPKNIKELITENQTVLSDYHTGIRKQFCFKPLWDSSIEAGIFKPNLYIEFDAKSECDCNSHNSKGPATLNHNLEPFRKKMIEEDNDNKVLMDNTDEIITYLKDQSVQDVFLIGVHTNMCMVFRKCGILHLLRNAFRVYLVKDLTDARISRFSYPYKEHFEATDCIINYIGNTPFSISGRQKKCQLVTSGYFTARDEKFHFKKDFRFPEKQLADKEGNLTDCYEAYCSSGRPGFPIAVYWRMNQTWIDTLVFEYANAKNKNYQVYLGTGTISDKCTRWSFQPGEYIIQIGMAFQKIGEEENVLTGLILITTMENTYKAGNPDDKNCIYRLANRNMADYFGNKDYAFLCPQMQFSVKNGNRYITGLEFYATTFNLFMVDELKKLRVDFCYSYVVYDNGNKKADEFYAFVFFEGEFYLYEKITENEYSFMRRTDSLAIPYEADGSNGQYKAYSLDAALLETYFNNKKRKGLPCLTAASKGAGTETIVKKSEFYWIKG